MDPASGVYQYDVYKYALRDKEEVCWSDHIPSIRDEDDTSVQLLFSYTINVRESELAFVNMRRVDFDLEEFFSSYGC
jgi:hypothetical protein